MENMNKFFEAIERQFQYGGKKYAQTETKESTDILFDDFGKNWLYGTIAKYVKRYSNVAREKDLLKIACYMFILWLKRGFHIDKDRIAPINTTVDIKSKYFPLFKERILVAEKRYNKVHEGYLKELTTTTTRLTQIYNILERFATDKFEEIKEYNLEKIFIIAYKIWNSDIKNKGKDEDIYNKSDRKKK